MLMKLIYRCKSRVVLGVWRTIPIEVRVPSQFLVRSDVRRFPAEKEIKRLVDDVGKKGRVDNVIPQQSGGKDRFTTENEVREGGSIMLMSWVFWEW